MSQKFHYNRKHQFMYFKKRDKIFFRLYKNYFIFQFINVIKVDKFNQRYISSFDIVFKINKQIYRLDIFDY